MHTHNNEMKPPEIKITYSHHVPARERIKITSAHSAYDLAYSLYDEDKIEHVESSYAIFLNNATRVLCTMLISTGGVSSAIVDPKVIFQGALKANATSIIITHNHPSGSNYPSDADKRLTMKIKECCRLFDMLLLDHIIITPEKGHFYSFAEEGNL